MSLTVFPLLWQFQLSCVVSVCRPSQQVFVCLGVFRGSEFVRSWLASTFHSTVLLTPLNCLFEELQKWQCPDYYENNVHKMQLPFSSKLLGSTLTAEEKQERRQQQLRRLQELNARRREEKLQLDQERLERLLYVQAGDVCGAGPWPCSARCSLPVWFP